MIGWRNSVFGRRVFGAAAAVVLGMLLPLPVAAGQAPAPRGDAAWVLSASALVLFMTLPGLALFYGGLVRARNLLSVLMHCFTICCVVSVLWALIGYSLAFGPGNFFLGGAGRAFLGGLASAAPGSGLPEGLIVLFQMTFAVITPALIIGAFPERVSFPFLLLFSALWLLVVYVPVAHWVWGGGWLAHYGTIDFAGGIVVHTTAGVAALVLALVIGRRRGFPNELMPPHSPGLTMAGAGMLWVGWFGFNGGSALAAGDGAGLAILATHLSASAAAITWMTIEWLRIGKPTSVGIVTGAVAGLATITPASGFVGPGGAMLIGIAAGIVCFAAVLIIKQRFRIDDSLDVFAVHGVGGMLGSLLVAVFALPALGGVGLKMGWEEQLGVQAIAVAATAIWSGLATFALIKLVGLVTDPRVTAEAEYDGLDLATHGERAYDHT
jgi:Amt family ammonium transporter